MSPRWFLGLFMLMIINTIISNVIEGADLMTASQMATVRQSSEVQLTEVKDPGAGGLFTTGTAPLGSWTEILEKAFTSDYSFFYNVDYTLSEVQCNAITDAEWNDSISACQYPNEFMILRYIFYWPMTAAVALFAILTLIQVVRGSG